MMRTSCVMVARSPPTKNGFQSRNAAKYPAIRASIRDLPARQPQISVASWKTHGALYRAVIRSVQGQVLVSRVKRFDTEAAVRLSSLAISPADLPAALNSRRRRSSSAVHFAYLVPPSILIAHPLVIRPPVSQRGPLVRFAG